MVQIVKISFFEIGTTRETMPPQNNFKPKFGFFYNFLMLMFFLVFLNRAFLHAEATSLRQKRHFPALGAKTDLSEPTKPGQISEKPDILSKSTGK